jgi:hypothetical protein
VLAEAGQDDDRRPVDRVVVLGLLDLLHHPEQGPGQVGRRRRLI